jgi:RecA-family ATPase
VLPEGVTLLAGKPKLGKSWLALGLCVAVASGVFQHLRGHSFIRHTHYTVPL